MERIEVQVQRKCNDEGEYSRYFRTEEEARRFCDETNARGFAIAQVRYCVGDVPATHNEIVKVVRAMTRHC